MAEVVKLATGAMGVEVVLVAEALPAVVAALAVGFVTALVVAALVVAALIVAAVVVAVVTAFLATTRMVVWP